MKFIDNSPIDKPATGIIVTTKRPVIMLATNHLYLLPSADQDIKNETIKAVESYNVTMQKEDNYVNKYRFTVLDEEISFDNASEVAAAIDSNGYNLVMPLYRPGTNDFQYLLAKAAKAGIYESLGLVYYTAERVTKHHLSMLIINKFQNDEPKKNIFKDFISDVFTSFCEPVFGMAPIVDTKSAAKVKKAKIDFHTKKQILTDLDDELDRYIKNSDNDSLMRLSAAMGKNFTLERFMNTMKALGDEEIAKKILSGMNPALYEVNSIKIEICKLKDKPEYVPPADKRRKNDGVYLLFINAHEEFCHVHFEDKSGFIIYLIYLLDRKKHTDKYEALDITKEEFKQEYLKLYNIVYPMDINAEESYFTLTNMYKKGTTEKRKTRLGECLGTIKKLVDCGCNSLGIVSSPHIIEDVNSHIFTDPSDIIVPQELLEYAV